MERKPRYQSPRKTRPGHGHARRVCAGLLCVLALSLCGCGGIQAEPPESTPLPAPEGIRIAVGSDLHLNPDNTTPNTALSAVAYNGELVDALLWDARQQGAELMLLTGDLVNGGRAYRHEALIEKLRQAEAAGMQIYVLPGNHDLAPIGQQDFAALYADFGYDEAYSRDATSLSYCVLREDMMLLMLDTAGYPADCIDLPGARPHGEDGAFLSEATLQWVESCLQKAQEGKLPVLCAGHYNLMPAESRDPDKGGYYLENGDRLAALLRSYGVPLYLSGHLHIRAVYQEDGLTELITEYLLSYPTGYTVLDVTPTGIRGLPRRVDVDAWAAESGQRDKTLLHFAAWQQKMLKDYSVENVEYMSARNPLTRREGRQAAEFFYAAMDAFWRFELPEQRAALEAMPGYEPFFRCAEGYAYGWWLKDLLANASPLLGGFLLEY
ncbi:MAG: metallophosphoesterase [Oscillospiraceae bacterium]|nr:metallophosphoesterase [Oscillospiraceae bacterium]